MYFFQTVSPDIVNKRILPVMDAYCQHISGKINQNSFYSCGTKLNSKSRFSIYIFYRSIY